MPAILLSESYLLRTSHRTGRHGNMRRPTSAGEIIVSRLRVAVRALFGRRAFAAAVAPVVEQENADAELAQDRKLFEPVRNVAGIAMTNEYDVRAARYEPAVDPHTVLRREPDVVVAFGRRLDVAARVINETFLSPHHEQREG